jgi:hypothetical protein
MVEKATGQRTLVVDNRWETGVEGTTVKEKEGV